MIQDLARAVEIRLITTRNRRIVGIMQMRKLNVIAEERRNP